jgi:hypothetical protein
MAADAQNAPYAIAAMIIISLIIIPPFTFF